MNKILHINQEYLDAIKRGDKTHEYRLGTPDRREVSIGDELTLLNLKDNVKVIVTDINYYNNWQDALINTWQDDFKGIFTSLDQAIKTCEKFYSKHDIKKYQIIVYTIKLK